MDGTYAGGIPVAPRAGAWIETIRSRLMRGGRVSPPARGRGLKPEALPIALDRPQSPPARGRGLKLEIVAAVPTALCRPPRGGVD